MKHGNSYVQFQPSIIEETNNSNLWIGAEVIIRPFATILCKNKIIIGDGTQISNGVTIVDHDHNLKLPFSLIKNVGETTPIYIGQYCWLGANSVILKGVRLGDGCVVGAGAVVLKGNYPDGSIIVGNPGKIIKKRI